MNAWVGIALVLLALAVLLAVVSYLKARVGLHPELARKAVHVGMGCITLTFPWIFEEGWPVVVLGGLAIVSLLALRLHKRAKELGDVLHGVERRSYGELYFPVSVVAVFLLSAGRPEFYLVPIGILTLADAAGALAGVRYGFTKYSTDEGTKSAEGSAMFFIAAFMAAHVPLLLLTNLGRAETLLISLTLGFLMMLIEAASWKGLDNLIVPLVGWLMLEVFVDLDSAELVQRLIAGMALAFFVLLWRGRTSLTHSAAIGGAFFGYVIWALKGWAWLVLPLIFYAVYAWVVPMRGDKDVSRDMPAVVRVMLGPMAFVVLSLMLPGFPAFFCFSCCLACHLANVCVSRLCEPGTSQLHIWLHSTAVAFGVLMVPSAMLGEWRFELPLWMGALGAVGLSGWIFLRTIRFSRNDAPWAAVWLREGLLAPAAAVAGAVWVFF